MLINVFSTHRSGSTWWTKYQHFLNPGSIVLNETFNQLGYMKDEVDPIRITHHHEYHPGCYWIAPTTDLNEIGSFYFKMDITPEERFNRWVEYIKHYNGTIICHTHTEPLVNGKYIYQLSEIADKNYFVYRDDVVNQLASFQIMQLTGEHAITSDKNSNRTDRLTRSIVERYQAEWHLRSIREARKIANEIENVEFINYNNMPTHVEFEGTIYKQNASAFNRLCDIDQEILLEVYNKK